MAKKSASIAESLYYEMICTKEKTEWNHSTITPDGFIGFSRFVIFVYFVSQSSFLYRSLVRI